MYKDNEASLLQEVCNNILLSEKVLLYNNNSFCKHIYRCLEQTNKIQNDSGHDAESPDFYSDELNIMFDIARVNDSEIKKTYNPTFISEQKMQQEIEKSWIAQEIPNISDNLICVDKDWDSDEIHNINHYLKNMKRVIGKHLSSDGHSNKIKDIWVRKHPNISRKGLLIYDETENYFQGICIPHSSEQWAFIWDYSKPLTFYKPWMDENIVKSIYQSDCDFLIWYAPYKWCGDFTRKTDRTFPRIIILDTRFNRTDYINYDYSKFIRT